jgi:dihydrolipoamide dehydrogenase
MSDPIEIKVPDIGDFQDVEIIEVHVKAGDVVAAEDPLVTLETDKASMDIPSPAAGSIAELLVAVGDKVSKGSAIVRLSGAEAAAPASEPAAETPAESAPAAAAHSPAANPGGDADLKTQLVVLGAGPGGYNAAFRAADLGLDVILIERYPTLGGVCLNVGCIPSKALLHAAKVIEDAEAMAANGIVFGEPTIEIDKLRGWKEKVVGRLTKGLEGLAKSRKVTVVHGRAEFASPNRLVVEGADGNRAIDFEQCIIAAGSQPFMLPNLPDDPRIIDSTGALELTDTPSRMLVVGGGIIGLEMATVYDALGSQVSVVELTKDLMPGCDRDLVRPLQKRVAARYEAIMLETGVTGMEATEEGIRVSFDGKNAPSGPQLYDRVLVAVGRRPNGDKIAAANAGVHVDDRGFIPVDKQMRTNVPHIFAIGDIIGNPMLAHKASHEGKVAAEVVSGMKSFFDARTIPSVAYTDPEVAWLGLTETEAKEKGIAYEKGQFPWAASGRSLAIGRDEGFTKILFDPDTHRVIGAGIVGSHAGDLIGETALAIEMGADAAGLGMTIHPHPTLTETVGMSAEAYEGTLTELYIPKKKRA